ncbi:MAG: hypothetical protein LZF86_240095 [Nitrospira sp.]|nr:MAG: hypothetical protein LZF86_240095 [Nitrospira sp.]
MTVSGQGAAPQLGVMSTIFSETNAQGEDRSERNYEVKELSGIMSYGDDNPSNTLFRQLTPYRSAHFPLTPGVTTPLVQRSGLDWGIDEDGDGNHESFSITVTQRVIGAESVTVTAGTFSTALRVEHEARFLVSFTAGGTATMVQIDTVWCVASIGRVREVLQTRVENGPILGSLTEELTSYLVNGNGGGLRIQLAPASTSVTLGGTVQLTAQVYDYTNRPISDYPFAWSTSNGNIVSVNGTGLVTGNGLGQVMIQAHIGSLVSNSVPITVQDARIIIQETNDLIYDSSRQRIYASVPSLANTNPDRIVILDPQTGSITQSIFVGDNPDKLALSDNYQYLYVAVAAPGASVRRINLLSNQVDLSFSVGANLATGLLRVDDMKVIPGAPQSLVVARMDMGVSPRHAGVAVFDNGVQRSEVALRHESSNLIEFGSTPNRLYGADRESSGDTLSRFNITASGVTVLDSGCCSFNGQFDNGFIFSTDSEIIEPELRRVAGFLPGISSDQTQNDDLIRLAPQRGHIYLLKSLNTGHRLLAFDRSTLQKIGSADLTPPFMSLGSPLTSFILWGQDGLAFRDGFSRTVVLLRTSILQ